MTSQLSAKITLWVNRTIALGVCALCFCMYDLLTWYRGVRVLPWQICAVILAAFYLCVPPVLYALWCIEKLLGNILKENVFIIDNVRYIRRIRCCAGVSLICAPAAWLYQPLIFMVVIMAFLALMVSVVKNVMAAAVEIREENDLTV